MKTVKLLFVMLCFAATVQAQVEVCMSYDDYKADQWKPYETLTEDRKPDSCRIKYDGTEFTIRTDDKEINQMIKKDIFMMSVDGQLFINSKPLRDEDGCVLPINRYTRAMPYKDGKLLVISYHVTLGSVLDLVNIGLDIGLLATGHYTAGGLFLAADLLLTDDNLMESHVLYLIEKGPNAKGKYVMTRINDQYMEKLLRDDPVTFAKYQGRGSKGERQSAANILPILVQKGMIEDYHHKKN
ncbi:MAG: hypothetical protein K5764_09140 [Prevotella sp.]|nr:hypothetical protein [Prevotella sp.]